MVVPRYKLYHNSKLTRASKTIPLDGIIRNTFYDCNEIKVLGSLISDWFNAKNKEDGLW